MRIENSYHNIIFAPSKLKKKADSVSKKILKLQKELGFDAIAITGVSGAGIGFAVSYITGIPCIYVRKSKNKTHGKLIEGPNKDIKSYIILDDFIVTGETIKRVVKNLKSQYKTIECCGIFVYDSGDSSKEKFWLNNTGLKYLPIYK